MKSSSLWPGQSKIVNSAACLKSDSLLRSTLKITQRSIPGCAVSVGIFEVFFLYYSKKMLCRTYFNTHSVLELLLQRISLLSFLMRQPVLVVGGKMQVGGQMRVGLNVLVRRSMHGCRHVLEQPLTRVIGPLLVQRFDGGGSACPDATPTWIAFPGPDAFTLCSMVLFFFFFGEFFMWGLGFCLKIFMLLVECLLKVGRSLKIRVFA